MNNHKKKAMQAARRMATSKNKKLTVKAWARNCRAMLGVTE
jgi:hypothetical protein